MQSQLFIDGSWQDAISGETMEAIDPATGNGFHTVAKGGAPDVEKAVDAARLAYDTGPWGTSTGSERAEYLERIADYIEQHLDRLAAIEVADNGKPMPEAKWDIGDTVGCFRYYAGLARDLDAYCHPINLPMEGFTSEVLKEPVGVVGAIIPWNFPLLLASWKLAPALAAGCTVVLKPSEVTPVSALELGRAAEAASLPRGVINVVNGDGKTAGAALAASPKVDKITFTGSTATGKEIGAAAADNVTRLSLELGGKSPLVIFGDTPIEEAVEWIMNGVFWNKGEVCTSTSRVLIEESAHDAIVSRLVDETNKITIGPGTEDDILLGPLVSQRQLDRVVDAVEQGLKSGARLLCGGSRPESMEDGFFFEPTIFAEVPLQSSLWTEEIFGPVLSIRSFETEAEAIAVANDSRYGLAAAVLSADTERARRVASELRAGIVWVNCSQPTFVEAPWGGYKHSGIGRELGTWGLDGYLEVKQVTSYDRSAPWGWYISE